MKANHGPEKRRANLNALFYGNPEHIQVNSVTIEPETQKEQ